MTMLALRRMKLEGTVENNDEVCQRRLERGYLLLAILSSPAILHRPMRFVFCR